MVIFAVGEEPDLSSLQEKGMGVSSEGKWESKDGYIH
jgi:hypothetical protein